MNTHTRYVVCSACIAVTFALLSGCDHSAPDTISGSQPDWAAESKALRANETPLIDDASPPQVLVRWAVPADGKSPVRHMDLDIENLTDTDQEVELRVASQGFGKNRHVRSLDHVRARAKSAASHRVAVAELPFQLPGVGVNTQVVAVWTGEDGRERFSSTQPIYVHHSEGFDQAFLRSPRTEASWNAKESRGLKAVAPRRGARGRRFDPQTEEFVSTEVGPTQLFEGFGSVIAEGPELPDAHDLIQDGLQPIPSFAGDSSTSVKVRKSGNQNLCFSLPYQYWDSVGDHLTFFDPPHVGYERARNMAALVCHQESGDCVSGVLNNNGCTGSMPIPDGTIIAGVAHVMSRSNRDIQVWNDDTEIVDWQLTSFTVSGPISGTRYLYPGSLSIINNVAVAANKALQRRTFTFSSNTTYKIFAQQDCPGSAAGCAFASSGQVFLGVDGAGSSLAWRKFIILHEVGHTIQGTRGMMPASSYGTLPSDPACNCSHVIDSGIFNGIHCLQSRDSIEVGQVEGFAHAFAADTMNNFSDPNCSFAYYKEFRPDSGPVQSPPVVVSCYSPTRWMENHCNASDKGTEYDWMGFFWYVRNGGSSSQDLTYANIESVWKGQCSGTTCAGDDAPWNDLWASAQSQLNSTKAAFFDQTGTSFGVDH